MKKIKNILILAGGDSTRFWPLKNKMLWSFLGKPLIKYLIDQMSDYGQSLTVVTNEENSNKIKSVLKESINIVIQNPAYKGMGGAIISCEDLIDGEVLILNGSDIFNSDLINKFLKQIKTENKLILAAKKFEHYFPGGYLKFVNGRLDKIVEKPEENKTPSKLVKLTTDYHQSFSSLVKYLKKTKTNRDDWYEIAINNLIKKEQKTEVIEYDDYLFPVKYPWHLIPLTNYFLSMIETNIIDKTATFSKDAVVKAPVFIGKNVRIGDFAKIVGPTYIDDNSIIADHTIVYQSHIGKNCLIGGYSEVTRSYLGDGVMLHRNYVGDSILGNHVTMGAQAATANLRFDEKYVRESLLIKLGTIIGDGAKIGVNVTCLPGVKIGQKALIGPGEVVKKDVENSKFIFK